MTAAADILRALNVRGMAELSAVTLEEAWRGSTRGASLVVLLAKAHERGLLARQTLIRAVLACAHEALIDLPDGDERPLAAFDAVDRWARGDGSLREVDEALGGAQAALAELLSLPRPVGELSEDDLSLIRAIEAAEMVVAVARATIVPSSEPATAAAFVIDATMIEADSAEAVRVAVDWVEARRAIRQLEAIVIEEQATAGGGDEP